MQTSYHQTVEKSIAGLFTIGEIKDNIEYMKKTLIITLEYPPQIGGIASYVYNLAAHLPVEQAVICAPKIKGDTEFDQKN